MNLTSPKTICFWAGFFLFLFFLFLPASDSLNKEAIYVAAVVVLMAIWWATEAIPLPATALLPLALFPLLGIFGDIPSKEQITKLMYESDLEIGNTTIDRRASTVKGWIYWIWSQID